MISLFFKVQMVNKKLILTLIYLITQISLLNPISTTLCSASQYCMACNSETNKCDACYNFDSSIIGVRGMNDSSTDNNCSTSLPDNLKVTDCKRYSGSETLWQTSHTIETCKICNTNFLNFEYTTGSDSYGSAACSNTPISEECGLIENCLTTVCKKPSTSSTVYQSFCYYCKKFHYGFGDNNTERCVDGGVIPNCTYYTQTSTSRTCYSCDINYAVEVNGLSCKSFSTDTNCRQLDKDSLCHYCWHSYYWANNRCVLISYLIKISVQYISILFGIGFFLIN